MTSTTIITVNYDGIKKSVAIFDGLSAEELSDVLCSTFFLKSGSIAGFQVDDLLIPISLACKAPHQLPKQALQVLVLDKPVTQTDNLPLPPSLSGETDDDINNSNDNIDILMPPRAPSSSETSEMDVSTDTTTTTSTNNEMNDSTLSTVNEILRFIQGMRIKKLISKSQADALEEKNI